MKECKMIAKIHTNRKRIMPLVEAQASLETTL
jgi:hypothetical protein